MRRDINSRVRGLTLLALLALLSGCGGSQTAADSSSAPLYSAPAAADLVEPSSSAAPEFSDTAASSAAGDPSAAAESGESSAAPVSAPTGDMKQHDTDLYSFSYPAAWSIRELSTAPGGGFVLKPQGREEGTNLSLVRSLGTPANIDDLEALLVDAFNTTDSFTDRTLKETRRLQVGGRDAVAIRHAATARGGQQLEGILTGVLMPNGEVLEITLGVFPPDQYAAIEPIYTSVLQSVQFK